jgi:hypothetical protein
VAERGKFVVAIVAVAFTAGAILYLWLRDEELTPAARAVLSAQAPNIPEEQNAYFFLLGLDAPPGSDPFAAGRAKLDEHRTRLAAPRGGRKEQPVQNSAFSAPKEFSRDFCDGTKNDCLRVYQRAEREILKAVADNPVLVQRCESLYAYPSFADPSTPVLDDLLLPAYSVAASCVRLSHALAAIDIKNGRTAQALSRLARDNAFWRMLLAQANTLITKMVAVAMVRLHNRLFADVLSSDTAGLTEKAAPFADPTRPITAAELDLTPVWLWEAGANARLFSELDSVNALAQREEWNGAVAEAWTMFPGYRRNATINMIVHRFEQISTFCRNKPRLIVQNRDAFESEMGRPAMGNALYNPIGKLLALGAPEVTDYPLRIHDLDALVRLVRLKQDILTRGVQDSNVQAFLDQSSPALFDPYTERPMNWDAARRVL